MAAKAIESNSKFNIYSSFTISADDVNTLTLLYAPLIGSDAFLLYMSFTSLLDRSSLKSECLTHQEFFEIYSLKSNDFIKARYKLEGIGLLITYLHEDGSYTYIVNPPFSPKNFLKDSPLGLYLYSKVSEDTYHYIVSHFNISKIDKFNAKNITKSFDDVFDSNISNNDTHLKFEYILGRNFNDSFTIQANEFDIDEFVKNINTDLLEVGVTNDFKDSIKSLAYVYGYTVAEMVGLFNDSLNKKGCFDYKLLKKRANTLFQYKRNLKGPKLVDKKNDSKQAPDDLFNMLENESPAGLLERLYPDYPAEYMTTISKIFNEINLPKGVINCMIIKVMQDKGGDMPSFEYFRRVSDTWISDGVLTTEDAMKYVTEPKGSKETKYNRKASKLKENPIDMDNGGFEEL